MRKVLNVLLVAILLLLPYAVHAQFAMHVIDVGQADAILLEFKSAAILIDAGGEYTGDDRYKEHFLSDLNTFFAKRGDLHRTLQAVIVTHPHIDHTRLLMDVFQNLTVKYFYDGGDIKGSGAPQLKQARDYASTHAIKYNTIRDDAIGNEGSTPEGLKKLSPGADVRFLAGSRDCANANNNSLVIRVHYSNKTVLLTGDSETDDDDECEEGQVEHLLERYQGTDLLRADVYKVGHHGSHNGTDQALVSAVSPAIAIISAGQKETKAPGVFHAFYFGHPREDVVELLESTAENRTPPLGGYTYLKGTKDKDATGNILEGREITKAIYCTCWDGDVTVSMNSGMGQFAVTLGERPTDGEHRELGNFVEPSPHPRVSHVGFTTVVPNDQTHRSAGKRITRWALFLIIPTIIYIGIRAGEVRRDSLRKDLANNLIAKAKDAESWQLTRFQLGAWIHRDEAEKPILGRLLPRPRLGIDEVLEQAIAELIRANQYGFKKVDESKDLIKKFEGLHSDPKNPLDLLGPLPSTLFLVAAVPVIVLFFAIQEVPSVGNYLTGIFGHNSVLEELWTGLLASIVGTGATLLGKKSVERRQRKTHPVKSQTSRLRGKKKQPGSSEEAQ